MKVAEYIVSQLISSGTTDAFGVPGGVILDLLYELHEQKGITPHLCYNEQTAGFAACGYAQISRRLGVVYVTKGPGFTNAITPMADAYYDSTPVLFITSHTSIESHCKMRSEVDQEMNTCDIVHSFTKLAVRIDRIEDVVPMFSQAIETALFGRQGPVLIDINVSLFRKNIDANIVRKYAFNETVKHHDYVNIIASEIKKSKRPIFLVGDGVNQAGIQTILNEFVEKYNIPVLSSRCAHNVISNRNFYFGYVGSHGVRYANFILSKADLVIVMGNSLKFPTESTSYESILKNSRIIHFDCDCKEFERHKSISDNYLCDLKYLFLSPNNEDFGNHSEWMKVCTTIRSALREKDICDPILQISYFLKFISPETPIVCDVGNNEFWVSRALVYAEKTNKTLYSKSFGALGCAIGKAVGVYYATKKHVVVFVGDQGFQFNIQELQYISQHKLPISIVVINNMSSGMIKDRELLGAYDYPLHVTEQSGYKPLSLEKIAAAYSIQYVEFSNEIKDFECEGPAIIELAVSTMQNLIPYLPKGNECQNLYPQLESSLYETLNSL